MKKFLKSTYIMLITLLVYANNVYASIDTDAYEKIYINEGNSELLNAAGGILAVFQVVGVATALVMIIVMAIKYMVSSVDEKAEIKKKMIPYIIGVMLLFGMAGLLKMVEEFAKMF